MNMQIKKYADSGDLKSLKYIFVDSLDVDPTFVRYEEEYNYCKSIPGLLEPHIELTPFRKNKADWNEEYWTCLKMDLVKNFSDRRMSHMREVAKVFLAEKIERILAERADNKATQNEPAVKDKPESDLPHQSEPMPPPTSGFKIQTSTSKAAEQARQLEQAKRQLEIENKAHEERQAQEAKKRAFEIEQNRLKQEQATVPDKGEFLKKAIGIAVAAIVVAVILFLLQE